MALEKTAIESGLLKKGFRQDETDHHRFTYVTLDGRVTSVKTKTSFSKKRKTIGDNLLLYMSRQCKLDVLKQFKELIICTLTREQYEDILRTKNLI